MIITVGDGEIANQAEAYSDGRNISKLVLRHKNSKYDDAKFDLYVQAIQMSDYIFCVWDGKSNDLRFIIEYAPKIGKRFSVDVINKNEPRMYRDSYKLT